MQQSHFRAHVIIFVRNIVKSDNGVRVNIGRDLSDHYSYSTRKAVSSKLLHPRPSLCGIAISGESPTHWLTDSPSNSGWASFDGSELRTGKCALLTLYLRAASVSGYQAVSFSTSWYPGSSSVLPLSGSACVAFRCVRFLGGWSTFSTDFAPLSFRTRLFSVAFFGGGLCLFVRFWFWLSYLVGAFFLCALFDPGILSCLWKPNSLLWGFFCAFSHTDGVSRSSKAQTPWPAL